MFQGQHLMYKGVVLMDPSSQPLLLSWGVDVHTQRIGRKIFFIRKNLIDIAQLHFQAFFQCRFIKFGLVIFQKIDHFFRVIMIGCHGITPYSTVVASL